MDYVKNIMTYDKFIEANPKILELDPMDMPYDLLISTMTLTCKIPVKFNTLMIAKHLELSDNFIQTIMCGNNGEICRTLTTIKPRKTKRITCRRNKHVKIRTTKPKRNFYNQVTIVTKCENVMKINIKLFKNGSIQITGCKKISTVLWGLDTLLKLLSQQIPSDNTTYYRHRYAEPYIFLKIANIYDFKIALINSNFDIGFKIDREKLFALLVTKHYECVFDPSRHAGVNIRYKTGVCDSELPNEKEHVTSIFVFDRGSIIITGARNYRQIMSCYKFINTFLIENYTEIAGMT